MTEGSNPLAGSRLLRVLGQLALGLVLLGAALGTWHVISPLTSPIDYVLLPDTLPALPRTQRPQTLDPALFTGRVADAYRVAREKPGLLERVACYCGCYLSSGHQNNLDCFSDRHPEKCEICAGIALRAAELEKAGYLPADIKRLIDRQFAPQGGKEQE
jgi:hypothetical protein